MSNSSLPETTNTDAQDLNAVEIADLDAVTGGTVRCTTNDQMTQMMNTLQTSLTSMQNNNNNQMNPTTMMMMGMMMSQRNNGGGVVVVHHPWY
jgi:hypothetical protein